MAIIKIKRGLKANLPVLQPGEMAFCTDTFQMYVGSELGNKLVNSDGGGVNPLSDRYIGIPIPWPLEEPPSWAVEYNGAEISRTTYSRLFARIGTIGGAGDGVTTFNLPDLRGEIIRGWDHGRGVDPGRVLGSWQADEFKEHTHSHDAVNTPNDYSGTGFVPAKGSYIKDLYTTSAGGSETRMRNVAFMWIAAYM